jgi:hypothetical protein
MKIIFIFIGFLIHLIHFINIESAYITPNTIGTMGNVFNNVIGKYIATVTNNYFNRTCAGEFRKYFNIDTLKKYNIPINEFCTNFFFDFTSELRNYKCDNWICTNNGHCNFDYRLNLAYCSNCTNLYGDYCIYEGNLFIKMSQSVDELYQILHDRNSQLNSTNLYMLNNQDDFKGYMTILQILLPFYATTFRDNNNYMFPKVDFMVDILFNSTNPSLNFTSSRSFINSLVTNSIYSFDFNYLNFITIFIPDDSGNNYSPYFGRTSTFLDSKNDIKLTLGKQSNLDYSSFSENYYYGSGGYIKYTKSFPTIVIKQSISQVLYGNYKVNPNGSFQFRILYVFSYIFNPRVYFTKTGNVMKTPIVSIKAQKTTNNFKFYYLPENEFDSYDHFVVTLPWVYSQIEFIIGDLKKNCYVNQWNELARMWYPAFSAYIDKDLSTNTQVTFYVKQFGIYAVDCDNLKKFLM